MSQQIEKPGYQRLQVTDQEQMTWENDRLNRKPYADRLTTLIKNTEGPYVIGLTSPWGSGKTFFLQAWHNQLVAEDKPCIYFNAWEMDASGDPLANLIAVCKQQADTFQSTTGRLKEKAKKAFEHLPGVIRGAGGLATYLGVPVGGAAEASAKIIETIQDRLKEKDTFKRQLTELASEIAAEKDFPLFIIIDELDRCRPPYTIDLLESIKHLFNVPHVVFLLAVDSTQLLQHVEHTFGLKTCVEDDKIVRDPRQEYLRKFFDIYFNLPITDNAAFIENTLDEMDIFNKYLQHAEQKNINSRNSLSKILTADKNIFFNKPLRALIQHTEKFSLYLRCFEELSFEEIFVAFLIIFLHDDNYSEDIGKRLSDMAHEKLINLDSVINNLPSDSFWRQLNIEHPELDSPSLCAYLFIIFSMSGIDDYTLKNSEAYRGTSIGYHSGKGFGKGSLFRGIQIKNFVEVTPTVIPRLQYLEGFSGTLSHEDTSPN